MNVLPIVHERHVGLAEANGVLALRNAIIDFEGLLGNTLKGGEKNGKGKIVKGSLPFEGSTFRCRGYQHPGDGDAQPESRRRREREGRGWKGWFQWPLWCEGSGEE